MLRKSIYMLLGFFILGGCSGKYIKNTYTIVPASEEDLQRFHEAIHGRDARLFMRSGVATPIKDAQVTSDSTTYLLRNPWRPGITSYDFFTEHRVPTTDILSVSICTERHATKYMLLGAGIGGAFSTWFLYELISAFGESIRENNGDSSFKLEHLSLSLPGAILGAVIGSYVGETKTDRDEYRFDHGHR